jgi:hypothetical protein
MMKMRHCFWCGAEIGTYPYWDRFDTCGRPECDAAAMEAHREERENANRGVPDER